MSIEEINDSFNEVYKPSHYASDEIEVIDFIEQVVKDYPADMAYHIGNTLKYIARAPHKGAMESDMLKAANYLNRAVKGVWINETD